jgi:hypothetical protein
MTAVGAVAFARRYWTCPGGCDGSYAADALTGVEGRRSTKAVQKHCCRLAAETSLAELCRAAASGPGHRQRPGGGRGEDVGVTLEAPRRPLEPAQRAADGQPGLRPSYLPVGRPLGRGRLMTPRELGYTLFTSLYKTN